VNIHNLQMRFLVLLLFFSLGSAQNCATDNGGCHSPYGSVTCVDTYGQPYCLCEDTGYSSQCVGGYAMPSSWFVGGATSLHNEGPDSNTQAAVVDGDAEYLDLGEITWPGGAVTYSMWIKVTTSSKFRNFFENVKANNRAGHELRGEGHYGGDFKFSFYSYNDATTPNQVYITSDSEVQPNVWNHITAVVASNKQGSIYLNGVNTRTSLFNNFYHMDPSPSPTLTRIGKGLGNTPSSYGKHIF
jgi:hypothetical protein